MGEEKRELVVLERTDGVGLNLDAFLEVGHLRVVRLALGNDIGIAQCVDKGGTTKTRGAYDYRWTKEKEDKKTKERQ